MKLISLKLLLASILSMSTPSYAEPKPNASELAEKMLERLGGKTQWAELKTTVNGSVQNRSIEPTEVYSVITLDFTKPRFKIETMAQDVYLVRVINGADSWRISWSGEVEDLPSASFEQDLAWYQAHVYRTIHRIASEDPQLTLKIQNERLEVHESGSRLVWFKLDAKAEPYAFGFREDDRGSLCGPWSVKKNGVRHPSWVSHADGTWRAAIKSLEFDVPLHSSIFARPAPEAPPVR